MKPSNPVMFAMFVGEGDLLVDDWKRKFQLELDCQLIHHFVLGLYSIYLESDLRPMV
jgi:hypothetical protein